MFLISRRQLFTSTFKVGRPRGSLLKEAIDFLPCIPYIEVPAKIKLGKRQKIQASMDNPCSYHWRSSYYVHAPR